VQSNKSIAYQRALAECCSWNQEPVLLPEAGGQAVLLAGADHMIRQLCPNPSHVQDVYNQPIVHATKPQQ